MTSTEPQEVLVSLDKDEIGALAHELASAYKLMANFYKNQLELPGPEADQRARGADRTDQQRDAEDLRIHSGPADQVSWFDLSRLAERNADDAGAAWLRVRTHASRELLSGHRTAKSLDWRGGPWQRARFLAIRDSFRADTPPQTGIESALLDVAAEAFGDFLEWQEQLHLQVSSEVDSERNRLERDGRWSPARLTMAEAIEQSSRMAERAHTRFLRSIKALQDLQRSSPTLFVHHAAQINVAQQQVNLTEPDARGHPINDES